MARTTRNKNFCPEGWMVRDNRWLYYHGETESFWWDLSWDWEKDLQRGVPREAIPDAPAYVPYVPSIYSKERTWFRRAMNRNYRSRTNHMVRTGRWDDLFAPVKTGGWWY